MNRYAAAIVAGSLILLGGAAFLAWMILTPSSSLNDLSPSERKGYVMASTTSAVASSTATSTASSTLTCAGYSVADCPPERWSTFTHPGGFSIRYPFAGDLKNDGEMTTIDLGYPERMRVRMTVLPASLSFLTQGLSENELYQKYGGDKRAVTVAGRKALTVSDGEGAAYGWLTYVQLDSNHTIFFLADFTEDFDTDQKLYGQILDSLKAGR